MNNRVLTDEKIQEAKKLKEEGKSKRQISAILGIAQTTVWDNALSQTVVCAIPKIADICLLDLPSSLSFFASWIFSSVNTRLFIDNSI